MSEPPEINLKTIYQQSESILTAEVDAGLALMNVESGNYYGLDSIGMAVWSRLDGTNSLARICSELTTLYEVEIEQCETDVSRLMSKLVQHGAVTQSIAKDSH